MINRTLQAKVQRDSYNATVTDAGYDLVQIEGGITAGSLESPSDPCSRWAGKIISLTGATKGYPTYADTVADGMWHPNCAHYTSAVMPYRIDEAKEEEKEVAKEGAEARREVNKERKDDGLKPNKYAGTDGKAATSGGKPKPTEFVPPQQISVPTAKTAKQAEAFATDVLGLDFVNYKGMDIAIANDINMGLARTKSLMPAVKINGAGSAQKANKAIKADVRKAISEGEWYKKTVDKYGQKTADRALASAVNRHVSNVGQKTIAWSSRKGAVIIDGAKVDLTKYNGVYVNEKFAKTKSGMDAIVVRNEKTKWFTKGAKDFDYIMTHEIGHEVDKYLDYRNSASFKKIYARESKRTVEELTDSLSKYGATAGGNAAHKPIEMIAESWAEYTTSKTPRKLAREIGDDMMRAYHAKNKATIPVGFEQWKTATMEAMIK